MTPRWPYTKMTIYIRFELNNPVLRPFVLVIPIMGYSILELQFGSKPPECTKLLAFLPRCMECRRGLAMRILSVCLSVRWSVCLSVCLSVCRTRALWQNRRKIGPDFYIIRKNTQPSFLRRMVGGGNPFYVKFWVNRPPLQRNNRFSTDIRS